MPPATRIRLYRRPDCHLCDQAREGLESLRSEGHAFELEEIDIESDERLLTRFLERIPVIEVDGEIIGELWLDLDCLRTRLDTVST